MSKRTKHRYGMLIPSVSKYAVDIVTPVYGGAAFLHEMLGSLFSHEAGVLWNLTLVDDKGPEQDELQKIYKEYNKRVTVITNAKNSGFATSNNRGFRLGRSPFLLMLNSDVVVMHNGWLRQMVDCFVDKDVGVVGAKLIFFEEEMENYVASPIRPPGRIQHAGVAFNLIGQPYHIFINWSKDHLKVSEKREMNAVTGACLMTRRSLYEQIGGLDETYTIGNFEDVQYCLTARMLNKKVIYCPESSLYHFSGGSGNSVTARFNEQLFQVKCQSIVKYDEFLYY